MCQVKAFIYACECFAYLPGTYKNCTMSPCLKTLCHETDVAEACREFAGLELSLSYWRMLKDSTVSCKLRVHGSKQERLTKVARSHVAKSA
jgi:hypothetical protein